MLCGNPESRSPTGRGNCEVEGHAPTRPTTLCRELCKNGLTDRECRLGYGLAYVQESTC